MHADMQLCQQLFGLGIDHEGKARVDYRDLSPRIKVSGRAYPPAVIWLKLKHYPINHIFPVDPETKPKEYFMLPSFHTQAYSCKPTEKTIWVTKGLEPWTTKNPQNSFIKMKRRPVHQCKYRNCTRIREYLTLMVANIGFRSGASETRFATVKAELTVANEMIS